MVDDTPSGPAYRAVNSCLVLLPMAAGHEIYTVEALADQGRLCEVQNALIRSGGSQCGYCTPGFVVSAFAEQYRRDRTSPCQPHELAGNLCRCTGYRPIGDALTTLGQPPAGKFLDRLQQVAPEITPAFYECGGSSFIRPTTLQGCVDVLAEDPDAKLIAGATDLAVESNLRGHRFRRLISVEGIPELRTFRDSATHIEIGAALTLTEIAALWTDSPDVFREWLPLFASPLIRNRATLGGNLATASPIGDGAPLLLAMDADLRVAGTPGERTIPLRSFFIDYRKTELKPGELILSIVIPKPLARYARFYKVAKRRMDDISTVAACFAVDTDQSGRIVSARLAYGGVAAVPVRAIEAESALIGRRWTEAEVHRVQEILARTLKPISDHRGSAEYRLAMAQNLIEKFWWERQAEAA
jgi:xanthine dehydrogenase small subunit